MTATDNNSKVRDTFQVEVLPASMACHFIKVPVAMLNFDPLLAQYGNAPMHQALSWQDSYLLAEVYIEKIAASSYGYIRYRVNYWQDLDVFPVKADEFQYNDTMYLNCWLNENNCH